MEVTGIGQGRLMDVKNGLDGDVIKEKQSKSVEDEKHKSKDKISEKELIKSVDKLNRFLRDDNIRVIYESHEKFKNSIMVKIINEDTKEVIMEIPPKKIVDMVAKMCEMVGILIDKKA